MQLDEAVLTSKDDTELKPHIRTMHTLADVINELTEEQLIKAIKYEKQGKNRWRVLDRLYGRYSRVRREREIQEMMSWEDVA